MLKHTSQSVRYSDLNHDGKITEDEFQKDQQRNETALSALSTESAETTMRPSDRSAQPGCTVRCRRFGGRTLLKRCRYLVGRRLRRVWQRCAFGLRETETELRTGGFDVDCEVARDLWRTGSFCFVEFTGTSEQHDDGRLLSKVRRKVGTTALLATYACATRPSRSAAHRRLRVLR